MPFSKNVNLEARKKAHFMCVACHTPFVEVHHIIPEVEGGPNTIDNAAPLCSGCHAIYGSNPNFRNQIKQMRDNWFDVCEKRFGSLNLDFTQKLDSMVLTLRTLRSDQIEYKNTLDEIKKTIVSSIAGTTDIVRNAQTYEEVANEVFHDFSDKKVPHGVVRGIAHDTDIASLTVVGIPARPGTIDALLRILVESDILLGTVVLNTNVKGTTDLMIALSKRDLIKARNVIEPMANSIGADDCISNNKLASVAIIGDFLNRPGYPFVMVQTLSKYDIDIRHINSSGERVTCYIDEGRLIEAVKALYRVFEPE